MKHTSVSPLKSPQIIAFLSKLSLALLLGLFLFAPELRAAEKFTPASMDEVAAIVDSHKGEVVVLNIFASWCPPCVQEASTFVQFYRQYPPSSGIHLYGISLDDNLDDLRKFINDYNTNFPVFHCGQDFVDYFEIQTIPTLIVFDREGSLVEYRIGIASLKELTDIMNKYK